MSPKRAVLAMAAFVALLIPGPAGVARAQLLAVDEFDGGGRAGWRKAGLGEWGIPGASERDGALCTTAGNHHRELAAHVDRGVVWYAVTLRTRETIVGYATVAPAESAHGQFSELGFNTGYGAAEGLWTSSEGIVRNGIPCTERQTFLARYDFDRHLWSAWAAKGDGRSLLDEQGNVTAPARVRDAALPQPRLGWLYVSKGSVQVLEIDRVALARSAREALTPVEGSDPPVESPPAAPAASVPSIAAPDPSVAAPPLAVAALAGAASPLADGDVIDFFGDSITWQGGFVDRIAQALAAGRPQLHVGLLKRGINGGKSTDLRDGCRELYGCTQAPLAQLVKDDRATAAVIFIGINDVWHGEKGTAPDAYRAALRELVKSAQATGCAVVVATPTLIGERQRGKNELDAQLDQYAQLALAVAAELGATPCDLRSACFAALAARNAAGAESGILTYDGVHMTDAGNELLADELAGALAAALRARRGLDLPLVPWPRQLERGNGVIALSRRVVAMQPELAAVAAALAASLTRLGTPFEVANRSPVAGDVVLALDRSLRGEAWRLDADRAVVIAAAGPREVAQAAASLLQLVTVDGSNARVPRLAIRDEPECAYRGLLLDVARQPHSIATIEQVVELCRLYKIAFLQLHLTDDQSFTFPSAAFPQLATPGRSYTLAQLRALEAFSQARGVTIVPELDMPGHCGAAIGALPELLRASPKHHATINFASERAVAAMETLVGEMLDVFRASPWFHLGGDECDLAFVRENPDFPAAFAREGVADEHALYCWFLGHMNEVVKSHGRRTLIWEGFGHGAQPEIPRDVTVMVYESAYHLPDCLVRDGYPVINASWEPLYVVNERKWEPAEIYAWDRFYWKHFIEGFPAFAGLRIEESPNVLGAQLCSWEQPEAIELASLRQRAAAFAERIWNRDAGRGYDDFAARLVVTDRLLERLIAR